MIKHRSAPRKGWKPHTYYVVEVSFYPQQPPHQALFYSGELTPKGEPGVENGIWNPRLCTTRRRYLDTHYLRPLHTLAQLSKRMQED